MTSAARNDYFVHPCCLFAIVRCLTTLLPLCTPLPKCPNVLTTGCSPPSYPSVDATLCCSGYNSCYVATLTSRSSNVACKRWRLCFTILRPPLYSRAVSMISKSAFCNRKLGLRSLRPKASLDKVSCRHQIEWAPHGQHGCTTEEDLIGATAVHRICSPFWPCRPFRAKVGSIVQSKRRKPPRIWVFLAAVLLQPYNPLD